MTIDSAYFLEVSNENGGLVYPFSFEVIALDECIIVSKITILGAKVALLASDFSIKFNSYKLPMSDGGIITLNSPLADGEKIAIQRSTPITNEQVFDANQSFNAQAFEFQIDKTTMILQEIEGHICNCATTGGSTGNPTPVDVILADKNAVSFGGFFDGHGFIQASDDGLKILWAYRGSNEYRYSSDGGLTWATGGACGTASNPLTSLAWDQANGHWYAINYDLATNATRIYRSINNGLTWALFHNAGAVYGHGLIISGSALIMPCMNVVGASLRDLPFVYTYNLPSSSPTATDYRDFSPDNASGWHPYYLGAGGNFLHLFAEQGTNENHGLVSGAVFPFGKISLEGQFGGANHRQGACRKQGHALIYKSIAFSNSAQFYDVSVNIRLENLPLPVITVSFETAIEDPTVCYSDAIDGYVVGALDAADRGLLHLRYCNQDIFNVWYKMKSVRLTGIPKISNDRQLIHATGDIYFFTYLQDVPSVGGSGEQAVLDKLVTNQIQQEFTVLSLCHYDVYTAGAYTAEVGPNITSAIALSATSKYGAGAMGFNNTSGGLAASNVILEPNRMTMEMYYRPTTLANIAGLWYYGSNTGNDDRMQAIVFSDGSINFLYTVAAVAIFSIFTPSGTIDPLDLNRYYELCFETEAGVARIYVDGDLKQYGNYTQTAWNGNSTLRIGNGRNANILRWSNGQIDEHRLTQGALYKGADYAPHTLPFTAVI